ncbi:MAG: DUF3892 domain-containing protein [Thermotaleaceae bacterium]
MKYTDDGTKYKIVAVRKYNDGSIESVKLDNGNVLAIGRAIRVTKEGLITNASIEMDDDGKEFIKPVNSAQQEGKFENYPIF